MAVQVRPVDSLGHATGSQPAGQVTELGEGADPPSDIGSSQVTAITFGLSLLGIALAAFAILAAHRIHDIAREARRTARRATEALREVESRFASLERRQREAEQGATALSARLMLVSDRVQSLVTPFAGTQATGPASAALAGAHTATGKTTDVDKAVKPAEDRRVGRPVELENGVLVPSRSLAAIGSLVVDGADGDARLYLNDAVEIDHLALGRWSTYFDFQHGQPYRRYRTVRPAMIDWNETASRSRTVLAKGLVEAI